MKNLKRSILYMTKEYIKAKSCGVCVFKAKREEEYLTETGSITFYFDVEGRTIGMYKVENCVATNYEWSGK